MASYQLFAVLCGFLVIQSSCFVFDVEEINSLNYVVDILDEPVLLSENTDESTVRMYNRDGQPYSCRLPDTSLLLQQERDSQGSADGGQQTSAPALLLGMSLGPCLQRTRDWWTYELCPMAEIRQYHMEGGQIVGKVSLLGRYESDYDWSQDDGTSRNAKQRYHSQFYTNGSDCDLTGRPRSAEVRFVCEEDAGDALLRVDEPETCRYVLTVQTARTCGHRALGPLPGGRPQTVRCRPALSPPQLERLMAAQLERSRREAERLASQGSAESEREPGDPPQRGLTQSKELFESISTQTKKLGNILDDVIHGFIKIASDLNMGEAYSLGRLHALRDWHHTNKEQHSERVARIMALFEQAEEGHYTMDLVKELMLYAETLDAHWEVTMAISVESHRLMAFIRTQPALITDSIVSQLFKTVSDLSSLSVMLRRFHVETVDMKRGFPVLSQAEETAQKPGTEDKTEDEAVHEDDITKASSDTEDLEHDVTSDSDSQEDSEMEEGQDTAGAQRKVKFTTVESLGLDKMIQVSEIDRQQRSRIEKAVKQKLGKIGLDSNGPEIKVRFLKYPDVNNLEKEHTLTDEEMSAFENALVTIMVGSQEALNEHAKHNTMAKNYEYTFEKAVSALESPQTEEEEPPEEDAGSFFTLV